MLIQKKYSTKRCGKKGEGFAERKRRRKKIFSKIPLIIKVLCYNENGTAVLEPGSAEH